MRTIIALVLVAVAGCSAQYERALDDAAASNEICQHALDEYTLELVHCKQLLANVDSEARSDERVKIQREQAE